MNTWWREISDLVLPVGCAGCGRPRQGGWCDACRARLARPGAVRPVRPEPLPPGLPPVWAAGAYRDELRAALIAHKERGALGLAHPLGDALAAAVTHAVRARAAPASVLLVPVPSSRASVAARGHDPARRMAARAARRLRHAGVPVRMVPLLRQGRVVADQAGLTAPQRLANLTGALEAIRGAERLLAAAQVVLVDDLLTTGASLTEAARAVRAAGGTVHAAAVVAGPPGAYDAAARRTPGGHRTEPSRT